MTLSRPVIGITGGSGAGKTTVARLLAAAGGCVADADALSRACTTPGQPAYAAVVRRFGPAVLTEDAPGAAIDRRRLGELVFNDEELRTWLEGVIHPFVIQATWDLFAQAESGGAYRFYVIDAPLLVEAGMHERCDSVWLVTAPPAVKLARIIRRDRLSAETARLRLRNRRGDAALLPFANVTIHNTGDETLLAEQVRAALEGIQGA